MESTDTIVFCALYLIIFGMLVGMTGMGEMIFSVTELITMMLVSGGIAITVAVIAAAAAGIGILGSGSGEAGRYVWKGALFALIVVWITWFTDKLIVSLPSGVPMGIAALFLAPPIIGIMWGGFKIWQGAKG